MSTYLEISPRRSGKSTRMLEAVFQTIQSQQPAIVVSITKGSSDYHEREFFREYGNRLYPKEKILVSFASVWGITTVVEQAKEKISRPRFFFDEFDASMETPYLPGSYYVTTPRFLRKPEKLTIPVTAEEDLLLFLLQKHRGHYNTTLHTKVTKFSPGLPPTETHGRFLESL